MSREHMLDECLSMLHGMTQEIALLEKDEETCSHPLPQYWVNRATTIFRRCTRLVQRGISLALTKEELTKIRDAIPEWPYGLSKLATPFTAWIEAAEDEGERLIFSVVTYGAPKRNIEFAGSWRTGLRGVTDLIANAECICVPASFTCTDPATGETLSKEQFRVRSGGENTATLDQFYGDAPVPTRDAEESVEYAAYDI